MVLTPITVNVPFPTGIVDVDLAGGQLVAVYLGSADRSAQLTIGVQVDTDDFRSLMSQQVGAGYSEVVIPLRGGSYMQVPDNLRNLPDDLRLHVAGVTAATTLTLMTVASV